MLKAFKKLWNDRRGNALVIAGAALPLVVGAAGLATDTIQWALWKRQLQRAADSAALAGVYDRIANDSSTSNVATAVADDLSRHNHTNIPLLAGYPEIDYPNGTNWTNPVRVELALQRTLGFSSLFMSSAPVITTRATAATVATGVYCVISLIDTSETGIKSTGNGDIDLGCGMITNSTSLTAAIATGSSEVNATPVAAVGDIQGSNNWGGAELLPFTVKQPDPYADINPPASFTPCKGNANRIRINNQNDVIDRRADTGLQCVSEIDVNGTLRLGSATYIIDGGNFSAGAQAKISCTGCTIILTNSDLTDNDGGPPPIGTVSINGGAEMIMSAPDGGDYEGILFYQDRRAEMGSNIVNTINGNSDSVLGGAFYFPNQQLQINGNAGLDFDCGKFVSYVVEFAGNGSINNTIDATCAAGGDDGFMGRHVRLVA
ncbi:MAG TPA: Tad domain-containing protein [Sphingomicrobium sp.]